MRRFDAAVTPPFARSRRAKSRTNSLTLQQDVLGRYTAQYATKIISCAHVNLFSVMDSLIIVMCTKWMYDIP
jgi:hypothetical protein